MEMGRGDLEVEYKILAGGRCLYAKRPPLHCLHRILGLLGVPNWGPNMPRIEEVGTQILEKAFID